MGLHTFSDTTISEKRVAVVWLFFLKYPSYLFELKVPIDFV